MLRLETVMVSISTTHTNCPSDSVTIAAAGITICGAVLPDHRYVHRGVKRARHTGQDVKPSGGVNLNLAVKVCVVGISKGG